MRVTAIRLHKASSDMHNSEANTASPDFFGGAKHRTIERADPFSRFTRSVVRCFRFNPHRQSTLR